MKRRTYLSGAVTAVGLSMPVVGSELAPAIGVSDRPNGDTTEKTQPTSVLLEGTNYETELYVIEGEEAGPTGIVVGGVHGDERSGYRAAEAVSRWQFDAGRVVVLPRANRPAISENTRHGVGGDLNRQFPIGEEPTTKLARAIWNDVVLRYEPDFLLDLHRSKGIYEVHQEFVGQVIFPTNAESAPSNATETVDLLNEEHVPWYMPYHEFKLGNTLYGTSPLLAHKAGGDLGISAYIVETARFLTDLDTRIEWTTVAAESLLSLHGIERVTQEGDR